MGYSLLWTQQYKQNPRYAGKDSSGHTSSSHSGTGDGAGPELISMQHGDLKPEDISPQERPPVRLSPTSPRAPAPQLLSPSVSCSPHTGIPTRRDPYSKYRRRQQGTDAPKTTLLTCPPFISSLARAYFPFLLELRLPVRCVNVPFKVTFLHVVVFVILECF